MKIKNNQNQTKGECGCSDTLSKGSHFTTCEYSPFYTPSKPVGEICECHESGYSCTGCELGGECESRSHFISKTEHEKKIREAEDEILKYFTFHLNSIKGIFLVEDEAKRFIKSWRSLSDTQKSQLKGEKK